jgi:hypothetical protein
MSSKNLPPIHDHQRIATKNLKVMSLKLYTTPSPSQPGTPAFSCARGVQQVALDISPLSRVTGGKQLRHSNASRLLPQPTTLAYTQG